MQPQLNPDVQIQPAFPIRELEQIESAIQASQTWLATLQQRRDTLTSELERIARPLVMPAKPRPKAIGPGLEYRGGMTAHWNHIDIHIDLLHRLWVEFPERRDAMARAVGMYGTTRTYVAKTREELFPGQSQAFAQRYSRTLVEGWYVDTNLNKERMRRILPAAVAAAGLKWGQDVKAYWRAMQAPQ